LAESAVKTEIYKDLQTLTTTNGYSTTIKTLKKRIKLPNDVEVTDCPLIGFELVEAPTRQFDEATTTYDLMYWFVVHVSTNQDLDDSGDVLDALLLIYQDLISLFDKQTSNTFKLDNVETIDIQNFYPVVEDTRGWAIIPMKITHKR